jgi:hypothetical protein
MHAGCLLAGLREYPVTWKAQVIDVKEVCRPLLWIATAVLGAAATLITSIGGLLGSVLFLLLATPLVVRGDHAVALSGLLMGFGGLWLLLMARQFATGGTLDNTQFWTAVGVLPLTPSAVSIWLSLWSRRAGGGGPA